MTSDTIYALSSGQLPAAVAIIRLSGPASLYVAGELSGGRTLVPRQAVLCRLTDPDSGEKLEDALLLYFAGPASFTGEDVVELQVTGSIALVDRLLAIIGQQKCTRMARPGEFARRAFLNGKMDLTEAEGLAALIDAETEAQRSQAMMAAGGRLRRTAEVWRARLLSLRADIEAALDFADAEDDIADDIADDGDTRIAALRAEIDAVLSGHVQARRIRRGIDIAIVGSPNVGKSSLLNALSASDAAIVSNIAGTTRDVIEVPLDLGGYRVTLIDTAGLRETPDAVEAEGVRRARERAASASVVIRLLADGESAPRESTDLLIRSKADLRKGDSRDALDISVRTGKGMDQLIRALRNHIDQGMPRTALVTTSARQTKELTRVSTALALAEREDDPVLRAEQLRRAGEALGAMTGHDTTDDILGAIFGRFCVGK
ncbi:MAG: tRNA uridine-5-carboxymethylaminomethyl(34) synthesis GTPase MnmE [Pacificimonas sp.]